MTTLTRGICFFVFLLFSAPLLLAQNIKINEICSNNYISYEDDYDEKGDWVEFYNAGSSSINMAGMYLTDDFSNLTKFRIPSTNSSQTTISANDHRVFWFDEETYKGPIHASFKLSGTGERLALVASNGTTIIDSITFSELSYDVTYGRTSDGSSAWSYFPVPTPDKANTGGGYLGIAGKAAFSIDAGFYPSTIQVSLTTPDPSSTIYYSLNGNEPSPSKGILYTGPITVSSTKAMRARVHKTNYIPGEVTTASYFINRPHDLPILSVVTDSANLWDENTGIYCFGVDDYDHFYPYYGANFWKSWKRPAHIELFEASGAEVISQNLKLSLSGNTSRVYAQKSLNFEAEDALGKNSIPYQLFPQLPIASYKAFKVRNGGSDWSSTGIRDAYNHTLLEGAMDVDHQANRPVILYMNGAYWGVISMTEKIDEDYLKGHYPSINKDSVDLLFSNAEVANGDASGYNAMISFITNNSLAQQSNYNYIKDQIDIQEYVNYFQSRIYYASTDWPNKNIYYWRPKDLSMKWRWIMWDTDRSDLLSTSPNHPCNYTHNTLAWATTSGSVASWAQFLLNNLLLNAEFKSQFIKQYAHHINFTFCPSRTDSVLDVFRSRLHNELPAHIARWEHSNDTIDYFTVGYYHSRAEWNTEVDTMKLFFHNRQRYMRKFIMQQFGISDTSRLNLAKVPIQGGRIEVDTFRVPSNPCSLVYFDGYPVTIKAVANPGYVFSGWLSSGGSVLPLTWNPNGDTTVTAYFSPSIATQPTVPASDYSASLTSCSNVQLNWTSGNGSSRIVIARAGSPVNAFPVDQQSYTANSVFGNGANLGSSNFVVYSGTSNTCTISGLSSGVTYHFAIIEFNGSASTSNYYTSTYLSGDVTTSSISISTSATPNAICNGASSTLSANGAQTYQWSPSTGLSSTSGSSVIASPASSTNYTVVATDAGGCQATSVVSVIVYPLPTVTLNNFSNVCVTSSPVNLTGGSPSGGTYSGNGVSGTTFNPSLAGTGNHTILYSYTNANGCSNSASKTITVTALPAVEVNTFNDICMGASPMLLSGGTPSGGTYSGTGVSGGYFNPGIAGPGIHVITYTYTSGCTASDTSTIRVVSAPAVNLNTFSDVCLNAAPVLLSGGTPAGGTYSGSGVSGSYFNPSLAGIGNKIITYSYTDASGCLGSDTSGILVKALPAVSLSAFNNICINAAPLTLTGGTPSGGVYTGTGVSAGSFNPSVAGIGSHIITYSYTNAFGCSSSATSGITVTTIPSVNLPVFNSVCLNSVPLLLNGGTPTGGTYSGPGVSGNYFNPSVAGSGHHLITYTFSSGCSASDTSGIFVNNLPAVNLNTFSDVCLNASPILLNGGSPGGGTYSGPGVSAGYFNPSAAGIGNKIITYSYTDGFGCSGSDTSGIIVKALPSVNLNSYSNTCINSSPITLTGGTPSGGVYTGNGVSGGSFNPSVAGLGTHLITYSYTNASGCSASDTSGIYVSTIPSVNLPSLNSVCLNSPAFLLNGGTPTGGSYTGPGVSGNYFNPSLAGAGYHIITYTYNSGCSASDTSGILVNTVANVNLNSFSDICINSSSLALSGGTPAGGIYSGTGVSGNSFNPSVAGPGYHVITYSYTNGSGCSGSDSSTIFVKAPSVNLNSFSNLCINSPSITLSGGMPAGGIYSGTGVNSGMFDPAVAGAGNHVITYSFTDLSGCTASDTAHIYVSEIPVVNLDAFNDVCVNSPVFILSGGSPVGGVYSGNGVSGSGFNPAQAGIGRHVITYSYNPGCAATDTAGILVNAAPNVNLNSFGDVCSDAAPFALSGGNPSGGVYSGAGVSNGNFSPALAGTGVHTITYTYTNSEGCAGTDIGDISVNAPAVVLSNLTSICINDSAFLLSGGTPVGGLYSGNGVSNGFFDPSIAGTGSHIISYSYTDTSGCSAADTSSIFVSTIPVVTLAPFSDLCSTSFPLLLTGGDPSGGVYSGTGVTGSSFDPSIAGAGTHLITYTYNSGCVVSDTASIVVVSAPLVSIDAFNDVCFDSNPVLMTGGMPAGGVYSGPGVSGTNFYPSVAGNGLHYISYTIVDSLGCSNTDSSSIKVHALPLISLGNDTTICAQNSILLDAGSGFNSYVWSTGETTSSIVVDSTGYGLTTVSYQVSVLDSFGCVAIEEIRITYDVCTDINSNTDFGSILVFPNPFNDKIFIVSDAGNFKITMFDVMGKKVLSKNVSGSKTLIEPILAAGIYFLNLETNFSNRTIKLVKTN